MRGYNEACYIFLMAAQEESYGKRMKRIRLTKRDDAGRPQPWTQYQLHVASGVSEMAISQIENGRVPQDANKVRLASALGAKELMPEDMR